jgi:putative transposase
LGVEAGETGDQSDDSHWVERLARIRFVYEQWRLCEAIMFAAELDLHLLPKVGYAWTPQGTQVAVMTPGTNEKHYLAGALDLATGTLHHGQGPRKTNGLFWDLLQTLGDAYPTAQYQGIYVVVDNDKPHKAKAVDEWLANHPRVTLHLFRPLVPVPTRSSAPWGICMTCVPAIIRANACRIWWQMSKCTST